MLDLVTGRCLEGIVGEVLSQDASMRETSSKSKSSAGMSVFMEKPLNSRILLDGDKSMFGSASERFPFGMVAVCPQIERESQSYSEGC